MNTLKFAIILILKVYWILCLENGLARTPPMGWLAWQRFRCNTDCLNDPDNCISDNLFRQMVDIIVNEGYRNVGYKIISLDDCWMADKRTLSNKLEADPRRFPSGMKALSDYIHSKGLLFGVYQNHGKYTCTGQPGLMASVVLNKSNDYFETDIKTFIEWDVDYIKLDGCHCHVESMPEGYPYFGQLLNKTGKPVIYSCSWPFYEYFHGKQPDYLHIGKYCNLWRNSYDIQDSWYSLLKIIDYYGDNQDILIPAAGPGHWNDPDMLIIGNFGLSYEQSKVQMAIWAVLASPLLMSVDLRTIKKEYKEILQNKKVIAVNQDPLGIQGRRIYKREGIEIWARPITPIVIKNYSYAIAILNVRDDGTPFMIETTLEKLGLHYNFGYYVEELFTAKNFGILIPSSNLDRLKLFVNPSGVQFLKFEARNHG